MKLPRYLRHWRCLVSGHKPGWSTFYRTDRDGSRWSNRQWRCLRCSQTRRLAG